MDVAGYRVQSNREAGDGRPDVVLEPSNPFGKDPYIVIEIRHRKEYRDMQGGLREALKQIGDQHYTAEYEEYARGGVLAYGICFCRKVCLVEEWKR